MNSKIKFLTAILLILGVVLLVGAGCAKKEAVSPAPTPEKEAVTPQPKPEAEVSKGDIGKMNDDLYVEILAQNNYQVQKDPLSWMQSGFEKFLKEKGVTQDQFNTYSKEVEADKTRFMQLMEKVTKRLQELSK